MQSANFRKIPKFIPYIEIKAIIYPGTLNSAYNSYTTSSVGSSARLCYARNFAMSLFQGWINEQTLRYVTGT